MRPLEEQPHLSSVGEKKGDQLGCMPTRDLSQPLTVVQHNHIVAVRKGGKFGDSGSSPSVGGSGAVC